jgi:hypothetical protein
MGLFHLRNVTIVGYFYYLTQPWATFPSFGAQIIILSPSQGPDQIIK